jgi:hypothetical protein
MSDKEQNNDIRIEVQQEDGTTVPEKTAETPIERFFYHQRRALEESAKALEALLPPGFREHADKAIQEFTTGFRILIDSTIDELKKVSEREEEKVETDEETTEEPAAEETTEEPAAKKEEPKPSTTGKSKVKVKVE